MVIYYFNGKWHIESEIDPWGEMLVCVCSWFFYQDYDILDIDKNNAWVPQSELCEECFKNNLAVRIKLGANQQLGNPAYNPIPILNPIEIDNNPF
jgi:hypothetical protein